MDVLMETIMPSAPTVSTDNHLSRPIPMDVYLDIFAHIQPAADMTIWQVKYTMSSLSLVCRFFFSVCHPRIYEHVSLQYAWPPEPSNADSPTDKRWVDVPHSQNLLHTPRAQLVRHCTLSIRNLYPASAQSGIPVGPRYCHTPDKDRLAAITSLTGLCDLNLWNVPLCSELIDTLTALPALCKLSLFTFTSSPTPGIPSNPLPKMRGPGLTSLTIFTVSFWQTGWSTALGQLVNRRRLRHLSAQEPTLILAILGGEYLPALEVLDLGLALPSNEVIYQDAVLRGIARCPRLVQVMLPPRFFLSSAEAGRGQISDLTCNLAVAATAVKSHWPITRLKICGWVPFIDAQPIPKLLSDILDATPGKIKELALWTKSLLQVPQGSVVDVPRLAISSFVLEHGSLTDDLMVCIDSLKRISQIKCKVLAFDIDARDPMSESLFGPERYYSPGVAYELDLLSQKTIMDVISDSLPNVLCVEIMSVFSWHKSFDDVGVRWHPSVLDKERMQLIIEGPLPGPIRDVDGCITDAFLPGEVRADALARRRPSSTSNSD